MSRAKEEGATEATPQTAGLRDSADPAHSVATTVPVALAEILHRHRQHVSTGFPAPGICVSRCADSQPRWPCGAYRAAAALEAVLKLTDGPIGLEGQGFPGDGQAVRRAVRAAITAELTAKEASDEH